MFRLTTKLAKLKQLLRNKHLRCTSHISFRVYKAKSAWTEAQHQLDLDPSSVRFREIERERAGPSCTGTQGMLSIGFRMGMVWCILAGKKWVILLFNTTSLFFGVLDQLRD
ncbi:hypothetical protein OIU84_017480 [Salix udensis]|uniref:Uncharacterized protein n=1 Tax=Salix udensis TaxID=889485 RepID=A0AAD6L341_9ROSI|nr:hypothetical protein OIU84_017480 [Salix udensis]